MPCASSCRMRRALALALIARDQLAGGAFADRRATPISTRIRGEIARLRKRLDDVRTQTRSAEHDLEEADLELGIRTGELQLAVDMQSQLEAAAARDRGRRSPSLDSADRAPEAVPPQASRRALSARRAELPAHAAVDRRAARSGQGDVDAQLPRLARRARRHALPGRARAAARAVRRARRPRSRQLAGVRRMVEQRQRAVAAARAQKERTLSIAAERRERDRRRSLPSSRRRRRRLEHLLDVLSRQNGAAPAAIDIRTVQGALAWPVQGKIIEQFGKQRNPKFSTVTFNNGLKIAAAPGTEVRAVFAGTVLFSQWFKGYGNLVILDHGNRVFSLYGNLKAPSVAVGDRVNAGQTIAGVGESEDAHSGYLYFEIRQDNKPEDPQKWLR